MTEEEMAAYGRRHDGTSNAMSDIWRERIRQMEAEGYSVEHDDEHDQGDMACAAAVYALLSALETMHEEDMELDAAIVQSTKWLWPWSPKALKRAEPRRMLVKAAALIVAEIERLDRATSRTDEDGEDRNG